MWYLNTTIYPVRFGLSRRSLLFSEAAKLKAEALRWTYIALRSIIAHMIKGSASSATQHFLDTGKSKFSGLDVEKAKRRVVMLNNARSLEDISPLKSVGLHKLTGDRKGQWAMIINGP